MKRTILMIAGALSIITFHGYAGGSSIFDRVNQAIETGKREISYEGTKTNLIYQGNKSIFDQVNSAIKL